MSIWSANEYTTPVLIAQASEETHQTHSSAGTPAAEHVETETHHMSQLDFFKLSMLAFIIVALLAILGTRRMKLVPSGLQNAMEWVFETLYGIPEMVMGPRGREYAPLIATFFLYIMVMNFTGLIPFLKSGTAALSITLGLAIFAFLSVQYYGFKTHGIRYLLHFLGPAPALAILIAPIEIIAELVRIASLSVRLYGNINGEETVIGALATGLNPIAAVVLLPLQLLTIVLQAYVFSLLLTVYISLATEKHEEHSGAETAAD